MADAALDVARRGAGRGRPGRRGRHHQPAGLDRRVGPGHGRAGRPRPRLAGPAHGRRLPGLAGRGPALRAQRVGHQGRPPARRGRPRSPAATCASARSTSWIAWHLTGGAAARHRPVQRRGHRAVHAATAPTGTTGCSTRCASPGDRLPRIVDSSGIVGTGHRPRRRAADRRPRRRPAGVAGRPGLRAARDWPRSPSAPAACSTCASGPSGPAFARQGEHGTFPIVAWRQAAATDVGRRGDHAGRRHATSSGCATTSASSTAPSSPTRSPPRARRPTAWSTCRRCSGWAPPAGTTAPAARCSASPGAPGRPQLVRAVLEGVAQRGADLVEAAEADTGLSHRRACGSTAA